MPTFNGKLTGIVKGQSGGAVLTGVSYSQIEAAVPMKGFHRASFGVVTSGISGAYSIYIVGAIGGWTGIIGGVTGIVANGNSVIGSTTSALALVHGRPAYVQYASAINASGFTCNVYMLGEY